MALERTVVAIANTSMISFWDKNLRIKLAEVRANDAIYTMKHDRARSILWVFTKSKLQKIDFTDSENPVISSTEVTGNVSQFGYSLDEATGTLYVVSKTTSYTSNPTLYKVLPTGVVDATISLPSQSTMGTVWSYADSVQVVKVGVVYDAITDRVIINYPVYIYNENPTGSVDVATYLEVPSDLLTYTKFNTGSMLSLVTYEHNTTKQVLRRCYRYSYNYGYEEVSTNMFINKVTGQINTFFDHAGNSNAHIVEIPNIENKTLMIKDLSNLGISHNYTFDKIIQDSATGDYILQLNNMTIWRIDALFTRAKQVGSIVGTDYTTAVNTVTSELYIRNSDNVYMYDSVCNVVTQTPVDGQTSATQIEVCSWDGEIVPNGASPARIIYPYSGVGITDTTPTIVMKVGDNLSGWTQQFRLCADMNQVVLGDNEYDYAYDRVLDSWANGASYDTDAVWEYCTDYDETSADEMNGTWNALGTEDGLQRNGVVPTNGVDSSTQDVYVRVTIPDAKELTGADANQKWYLKVYSYSRQ